LLHRAENFGTIFFRIDVQTAGRYAVLDQPQQCASGFDDIRRQAIHLDVAIVADQNALVRIEQNDALRHVVDNQCQKRTVAASAGRVGNATSA